MFLVGGWCVNHAGNPVYVQSMDVCADGSFKIPSAWCNEPIALCPNSSWTLSEDKKTCFRSDDACWKDIENVSEVKLLAAMAYGESHWSNVYEEMAGIASAIVRKRDALHFVSVNELVQMKRRFSYVVYNKNERFVKVMCGNEANFKKTYEAATNALNHGTDYSNGACYWDGYDLKISGTNHDKYIAGFRYSDPSHNIFSTPEPPHIMKKGRRGIMYDTTYLSTITQGKTVFWKLDENYTKAKGEKQCS